MARIKKINLQNFKIFQQRVEIGLDNKHLLVYGENGGGKSSLYWAIYTLLECANKDDDSQIAKYFTTSGNNSLTNVFLQPSLTNYVESKIEVEINDGTTFKASLSDFSIRENVDAQNSNYASEFLNYKMLFRLNDFTHAEDNDLFSYFEREVLPYVKFTPVKYWKKLSDGTIEEHETESAKQIWDFIINGPQKSGRTKKGTPRYPLKRESDYSTYINIINGFKTDFQNLLTFINTEGNPILKIDLDNNFEYKLELIETKSLRLTELQFDPPVFQVKLTIPDFYGSTNVLRPHTFLNEARLSALGLAIRFAILKKRLQIAKLKLAILDDFMISLDMNNRDVTLDYIFDKVVIDYQTIILTHDKYLYELIKNKIQRRDNTDQWITYEMFEDEQSGTPIPIIIQDNGKIKKAWTLFYLKDYSLSANMVRQASEKLCKKYLTNQELLGGDYKPMKLEGMLLKFISKGTTNGLNIGNLNDLKDYKDRIMNPSSHYDIETPLFKNELKKAIETIERIAIETGYVI